MEKKKTKMEKRKGGKEGGEGGRESMTGKLSGNDEKNHCLHRKSTQNH